MRTLVAIFIVLLTILQGSDSVDLQCDFVSSYGDVAGTSCQVTGLVINNQNDTITSVDGKSSPLLDINSVNIYSPIRINYFPRGLDKLFPNLEALQILDSPLKSVEQVDLKHFGKLKKFVLRGSEIENIESDLFEHNPEIRWIGLHENKLKAVGKNILKPLKKLQKAYFYGNICINKDASSSAQMEALVAELEEKCPSEEKTIANDISNFFSPLVDLFTSNDVEPAKSKLEEESTTKESFPSTTEENKNEIIADLGHILDEIKEAVKEVQNVSYDESTVDPDAVADLVILEVNSSSRPLLKTITQIISLACVAFFSLS